MEVVKFVVRLRYCAMASTVKNNFFFAVALAELFPIRTNSFLRIICSMFAAFFKVTYYLCIVLLSMVNISRC